MTTSVTEPQPPIDEDGLVVSVDDVVLDAGLDPDRLSLLQRRTVARAIRKAQAAVAAYLGRPVLPVVYTETSFAWPDGWRLTASGDDPVIEVLTVTPAYHADGLTPNGYYTVTYRAGIDAATDPLLAPIREYVAAHALNSQGFLTMWRTLTDTDDVVTSVSAEGQSTSFRPASLGVDTTTTRPGDGAPGSLPTLASLDRWRLAGRRVHVATPHIGYYDRPWGW